MSRDDDYFVAEILGWGVDHNEEGRPSGIGSRPGNPVLYEAIPAFTTDPAADYMVLEFVRRYHNISVVGVNPFLDDAFAFELWSSWNILPGEVYDYILIPYKPGDYSRALLALKDKGII